MQNLGMKESVTNDTTRYAQVEFQIVTNNEQADFIKSAHMFYRY